MNFFNRSQKLKEEEKEEGARKRQQIISDAQAMKRLQQNDDFKRFCELLKEEKEEINGFLLNENGGAMKENEARTRLIARINQIDRVLNKPRSLIWQMENLTEVRAAIREQHQTHERQALGNKTGGK
jgi:hypothetical protein